MHLWRTVFESESLALELVDFQHFCLRLTLTLLYNQWIPLMKFETFAKLIDFLSRYLVNICEDRDLALATLRSIILCEVSSKFWSEYIIYWHSAIWPQAATSEPTLMSSQWIWFPLFDPVHRYRLLCGDKFNCLFSMQGLQGMHRIAEINGLHWFLQSCIHRPPNINNSFQFNEMWVC